MDISSINPIIIIGVIISAVVAFNILLFLRFKNHGPDKGSEIFSSLINTAKNPWGKFDKELDELSELVRKANRSSTDVPKDQS
jgi:hypothetical protein